MKEFLFFVLRIIIVCIVISIALDFLYTGIYLKCDNRRKIGYIYNSEPKEIDVVILGSSRANNHFVPQLFTEKGLTAFNYGMQGSKLFESNLVLKLLLERKNEIKTVILQVDSNLKSGLEMHSDANVLKFMPFLFHSESIHKQLKDLPDHNYEYWIPFYRYLKYENKLGFREVLLSALNKKSKELDNGGYNVSNPGDGKLQESFDAKSSRNKYYEEIKQICNINKIRFIPIMTPMCQNATGYDNYLDDVHKIYPEIYNYANVIKEDKFFSTCGHMNDKGAKLFTVRILKDFFQK